MARYTSSILLVFYTVSQNEIINVRYYSIYEPGASIKSKIVKCHGLYFDDNSLTSKQKKDVNWLMRYLGHCNELVLDQIVRIKNSTTLVIAGMIVSK